MNSTYIMFTEAALDAALVSGGFSKSGLSLRCENGVFETRLSDSIVGYRTGSEPEKPYVAIVGCEHIEYLVAEGGTPSDVYQRVARVLKGFRNPPVHLPRQWLEYHHRNMLAFFALPRDLTNIRWIVELDSANRFARFDYLSSETAEINLADFLPFERADDLATAVTDLRSTAIPNAKDEKVTGLAQEVDLHAIGSSSVVSGRSFEAWLTYLTPGQKEVLESATEKSIRIVGPAGSGKTLLLCMRALKLSRDESIVGQGKRILFATHSWAMSERIDGVLRILNNGVSPDNVTAFPLLSLLELHAGHIGHRRTEVIGDDSTDGRLKSLDIISSIVSSLDKAPFSNLSREIADGLASQQESRARIDLILNLYEELSGVITASGVAPDDPGSIQEYIGAKREEWMPPFVSIADRGFAIVVFKRFTQRLVDRAAITTDQFVLDAIRVLETFTWRMRKETEGYDFIFVDELQLFDSQERSALELLGRSRRGVPFTTAEDPSQSVFSALNGRRVNVENAPVYLDTVHRFNREIFNFINFLYQKFPLNALPLKIDQDKNVGDTLPRLFLCGNGVDPVATTARIVKDDNAVLTTGQRIGVITLSDVNAAIAENLVSQGLSVSRLESFDDVEQLSYKKRSIVISPWQFIGGTQFSHVIVVTSGIGEQVSQFGRLREMISVYLSCSRAAISLSIVCDNYVPPVLAEASEQGLIAPITIQ